jgi:hypothetical protein
MFSERTRIRIPTDGVVNVKDIFALDLRKMFVEVLEIVECAHKEKNLEVHLEMVEEAWNTIKLQFTTIETIPIISNYNKIFEIVEGTLLSNYNSLL